MKRSKHNLSHYRLTTFDMGELVPVSCYEVLPGDTVQQSSSALLRVSPLLAPVMHPVSVRIHHWFVPYRLLWPSWESFITGGPTGTDASVIPTITANFAAGSIPDYLGVPIGVANTKMNAFAVRAYNKIFNEFYRDPDLVSVVTEDSTTVQKIAWEKDYLTSARVTPQKGNNVLMPLGSSAPVYGTGKAIAMHDGATLGGSATGSGGYISSYSGAINDDVGTAGTGTIAAVNKVVGAATKAQTGANDSGLYADLSSASAVNVRDVREAFALQRFQEIRSRYGSRYSEYLRYLGVRSSDARLQRPEYLGGGKQTISFSEVLQSSPNATGGSSGTAGVGELRGHGISAMRSRRYRRFFEEHGVVLSLMSVRPRTMYANGLHRMYSRVTKEDFWQKEYELIGQQEVYNQEVYFQGTAADTQIFGYQDRYAEYRHMPSGVSGDFRSTLLDFYHLARKFGALPSLNGAFVTCDPSKRINQVQTNDVLWVMANHNIVARRLVLKNANSRII